MVKRMRIPEAGWRQASIAAGALALLAVGCRGDAGPDPASLFAVTTTTILGDVVAQMADEAARIDVLIPLGLDPHDFQPSARQAALLADADLVVANGLGLEEGLQDLLDGARADGTEMLEVAELLNPLPLADGAGPGDGVPDPHVWLDPVRMADAVRIIGQRLAALDTSSRWEERAAAYANEILRAHDDIAARLATVPPARRKLVTNHDALGYFAGRYGFAVIGVVIPGGSTLAEPSAQEISKMIDVIETEKVPAIFIETTHSARLAEAIAAESGHRVEIVELFTGSLGEQGSGAETYLGMLETNADRISRALSEG